MEAQRYTVIFEGQLQPGKSQEEVQQRLAQMFKLDPAQAARLFSGQTMRKTNLTKEQAARYQKAFHHAGAVCRVVLQPAATTSPAAPPADVARSGATMTCPKCGQKQPRAGSCSFCGAQAAGAATAARPQPRAAATPVPAATMECPKCGQEQAKAAECAYCGVLVSKVAAASALHGRSPREIVQRCRSRVQSDAIFVAPDIPGDLAANALLPFRSEFAVWSGGEAFVLDPAEEILLIMASELHLRGGVCFLVVTDRKLLHAFTSGAHECMGFELAEIRSLRLEGEGREILRVNDRTLTLCGPSQEDRAQREELAKMLLDVANAVRAGAGRVPRPAATQGDRPILVGRVRVLQEDPGDDDDGFFAPEKKGIKTGMLGGLAMMAIAAVWFGLGYKAGYVFFYPPVLFLIGLFAFAKGLFEGNVAGR
jgi:hypothetical protein